MMVKWCDPVIKAKEIDDEADWNKIFAASVFFLGLVLVIYFCLPDCYDIDTENNQCCSITFESKDPLEFVIQKF